MDHTSSESLFFFFKMWLFCMVDSLWQIFLLSLILRSMLMEADVMFFEIQQSCIWLVWSREHTSLACFALVQYTILSENTQDTLQPQQAETVEALLLMHIACQVFVAL